jgi:hypothetical protein
MGVEVKRMTEQVQNYYGEYLGGHSMYANKRSVVLSIYPREVAVDALGMHIPYSAIKEVKNVNESNMKALRVIAFGVVGALWKKKETYLCLVYNDGIQDQNPVFKLDNLDRAQREIYQRVVQARTAPVGR